MAAKVGVYVEVVKDRAARKPWVMILGRDMTFIVDHEWLQKPETPLSRQGLVYELLHESFR